MKEAEKNLKGAIEVLFVNYKTRRAKVYILGEDRKEYLIDKDRYSRKKEKKKKKETGKGRKGRKEAKGKKQSNEIARILAQKKIREIEEDIRVAYEKACKNKPLTEYEKFLVEKFINSVISVEALARKLKSPQRRR